MNREKVLVKNTFILTIGKVCTQLITFFLLPLYTNILSTEEYGMVDLLNTLVSLLLPIVTFQIEQALFRNLIELRNCEDKKKIVISTAIFSVIIQCIIYLFIFFIIYPFIKNKYKVFLATNVIVYIFSSLFLQISRGLGSNKQFSIASFISAFVTIFFNIVFLVHIKLGVNGMLLSNMLGQIVCIFYLLLVLKLYRYISYKTFKIEVLKKLWKYSIPLIPNQISWWIFNASDRVIVSTILGIGQNGILSAAHKFSTVYVTLFNMFNMSWIEMVSININDTDIKEFFNRTFNKILKLFVSIAMGIITCMPFVYPVLINSKFGDGYYQIPIMIFGSVFNITIGLVSVIYTAKKNTKAIANTSVISATINIIFHLALINFIGLYAATVSTFLAYFIMMSYRLYDISKKYFKITIDRAFIFKTICILIVILPIYYSKNYFLYIISILLTIYYAWNVNKNSICFIFKLLKIKLHKNNV